MERIFKSQKCYFGGLLTKIVTAVPSVMGRCSGKSFFSAFMLTSDICVLTLSTLLKNKVVAESITSRVDVVIKRNVKFQFQKFNCYLERHDVSTASIE